MKFNLKNKATGLFSVIILISFTSNAQEFKNDVSIKDQLKNNSTPGLKYATAEDVKAKPSAIKPYQGSSLAHQLKTGTMQGVTFAPGTGNSNETNTKAAPISVQKKTTLPSDMTPEQIKQANELEVKKQINPVPTPEQKDNTKSAEKTQQKTIVLPDQKEITKPVEKSAAKQ